MRKLWLQPYDVGLIHGWGAAQVKVVQLSDTTLTSIHFLQVWHQRSRKQQYH